MNGYYDEIKIERKNKLSREEESYCSRQEGITF